LVYNNLQNGASNGSYNTKTLATVINRIKAASVIFYSTPGPKMLWQFGELGYDKSINTCSDGVTISNDCRTSAKPIKWDYQQDATRSSLFTHISTLIGLRNKYSVFTNGDATLTQGTGLAKQIALKNKPYTATPATTDQMNVVSVANFNLSAQTITVNFPHPGTWYDYFANNQAITVGSASLGIEFQPGQYRMFTDVRIGDQIVTSLEDENEVKLDLFPNPSHNILKLQSEKLIVSVNMISLQGSKVQLDRLDDESWDVGSLASGLYIAEIRTEDNVIMRRVIKK
jgi:Secretion system C-terminal sorting domain